MKTTTYTVVDQNGNRTNFECESEARGRARELAETHHLSVYILEVETRFLAFYTPPVATEAK